MTPFYSLVKLLKKRRFHWLWIGMLLSIGAPLGLWILLSLLNPPHMPIFETIYLYTTLGTFGAFSLFGWTAGLFMERIEYLSYRDALTGLFNRRYFFAQMQELLALSVRYQQPFSVIMLDLDHFKKVNDTYGHQIGDLTLKVVSKTMSKQCRQTDILSRYGGEEFAIVCPNTSLEPARQLAERIREAVSRLTKLDLEGPDRQTISLGVASVLPKEHTTVDQLLKEADLALYKSKQTGRNKVSVVSISDDSY